ncbi:hypothetical protein NYE69_01335 [Paenibacillus sp. FSL R5-0527]|uniref:hypothetical protein n=1 Tax=Paenibacillus TaxID=44249 RepID=UPI00097AEE22|nr:hypothetical protein [Paenibacillus macerans]MED4959716.1 hypothetical protein [Paenibacillus macerans]OMG50199.1 hypothetical protein BK140_06570 [Paenibacillus macerans]
MELVLAPNFVIGHIRVGTVEGSSCINIGNNLPSGFTSHKKQNQGLSVSGDHNELKDIESLLDNAGSAELLGSVFGEDAAARIYPKHRRNAV